jgi:hypothetical protein
LTYGCIEVVVGVLLVLAAVGRGRIPAPWLDVLKGVGHADVGAFAARWLLANTRGLQKGAKFLIGLGLVLDGGVRAGLCAGVLRQSRVAAALGVVFFGAIAMGGLFVAGVNPSPIRLATLLANAAIAFVDGVEAYRLRRGVYR